MKFIGSVETTIDDKCRVTLPPKFRNKLSKPLKIEQENGYLKCYESDDGVVLDAQCRLQLGKENVDYLKNRNIVMSGQGSYLVIENKETAQTIDKITPEDVSRIYDEILRVSR